jgi:membrane protein
MRRRIDAAASHLPPRLSRWIDWGFSRWPGRVLTGTATGFARIELFDRAMTIAAQFFTSIFPILLMASAWFGVDSKALGGATGLPQQAQEVLDEAVNGSTSATFGTLGALIVLVSATSLSRALTRAYAAIWVLPRPTLSLGGAWRWVAALLALALAVVVTFTLTKRASEQPPRGLWGVLLSFTLDLAIGVFVPWVLLARQVRPRHLLPGAILMAVTLMFVRPATAAWMPHALDVSARRYGPIGVAFTYLACLYTLSFCWLTAALVGQVVTTDEGPLGAWIRGRTASERS